MTSSGDGDAGDLWATAPKIPCFYTCTSFSVYKYYTRSEATSSAQVYTPALAATESQSTAAVRSHLAWFSSFMMRPSTAVLFAAAVGLVLACGRHFVMVPRTACSVSRCWRNVCTLRKCTHSSWLVNGFVCSLTLLFPPTQIWHRPTSTGRWNLLYSYTASIRRNPHWNRWTALRLESPFLLSCHGWSFRSPVHYV